MDLGLKKGKFFYEPCFGGFNGVFDFGGVDVHGSELFEVVFGVVDDDFEGFDLVIFVVLVVADAADDTVVDAVGFEADNVEDFSDMVAAFSAFGVPEMREFSC